MAKVAGVEVSAAARFDDIAVACPVAGSEKWRRLAEPERTCGVTVNIESEIAASWPPGSSSAWRGWSGRACRRVRAGADTIAAGNGFAESGTGEDAS